MKAMRSAASRAKRISWLTTRMDMPAPTEFRRISTIAQRNKRVAPKWSASQLLAGIVAPSVTR